jgi:chromosome segregation ATPase
MLSLLNFYDEKYIRFEHPKCNCHPSPSFTFKRGFFLCSTPVDSFFTVASNVGSKLSVDAAKAAAEAEQLQQQLDAAQQLLELRERQLAEARGLEVENEHLKQQVQSIQQDLSELRERQLAEATASELTAEQLKLQLSSVQQQLEASESQLATAIAVKLETFEHNKQLDLAITNKDGEIASLHQQLEQLNEQVKRTASNATPQHESTPSLLHQPSIQAQEDLAAPTTAHLFAAEPSQLADLFAPLAASPVADPFSIVAAADNNIDASGLFAGSASAAGNFPVNQPAEVAEQAGVDVNPEGSSLEPNTTSLPQPLSFEDQQAWYQQQLDTYQQAINDWQAWGELKGTEVEQLQASLASLGDELAAAQQQIESLRATSAAASADPGTAAAAHVNGGHDRVNEILKLMRIKDLELEELRETIDRLETEKADLGTEVREALEQVAELEAVRDQAETHRGMLQLFEETKAAFERLKEEEHRLR